MAKLDYQKSGRHEPDPARVIEVQDNGGVWCGSDDEPFETQIQRERRYAATRKVREVENASLLARSAKIRLEQIAKKKARLARAALNQQK